MSLRMYSACLTIWYRAEAVKHDAEGFAVRIMSGNFRENDKYAPK